MPPLFLFFSSSEYNVSWFKRFDLVLNALDNRQARCHVNRMCLAADVPLVESGSAGYLGQVGGGQAFSSLPKDPPKTNNNNAPCSFVR